MKTELNSYPPSPRLNLLESPTAKHQNSTANSFQFPITTLASLLNQYTAALYHCQYKQSPKPHSCMLLHPPVSPTSLLQTSKTATHYQKTAIATTLHHITTFPNFPNFTNLQYSINTRTLTIIQSTLRQHPTNILKPTTSYNLPLILHFHTLAISNSKLRLHLSANIQASHCQLKLLCITYFHHHFHNLPNQPTFNQYNYIQIQW